MQPTRNFIHPRCDCRDPRYCQRSQCGTDNTLVWNNACDVANTLAHVITMGGIHKCKAQMAVDEIKLALLYYDKIYGIGACPRRRLRKENFMHDLGRKCQMTRSEAQLIYSILKPVFKAFYSGTCEGYPGRANALDAQSMHTQESMWVHAAKRTVQIFASFKNMFLTRQTNCESEIMRAFKNLYQRLEQRATRVEAEKNRAKSAWSTDSIALKSNDPSTTQSMPSIIDDEAKPETRTEGENLLKTRSVEYFDYNFVMLSRCSKCYVPRLFCDCNVSVGGRKDQFGSRESCSHQEVPIDSYETARKSQQCFNNDGDFSGVPKCDCNCGEFCFGDEFSSDYDSEAIFEASEIMAEEENAGKPTSVSRQFRQLSERLSYPKFEVLSKVHQNEKTWTESREFKQKIEKARDTFVANTTQATSFKGKVVNGAKCKPTKTLSQGNLEAKFLKATLSQTSVIVMPTKQKRVYSATSSGKGSLQTELLGVSKRDKIPSYIPFSKPITTDPSSSSIRKSKSSSNPVHTDVQTNQSHKTPINWLPDCVPTNKEQFFGSTGREAVIGIKQECEVAKQQTPVPYEFLHINSHLAESEIQSSTVADENDETLAKTKEFDQQNDMQDFRKKLNEMARKSATLMAQKSEEKQFSLPNASPLNETSLTTMSRTQLDICATFSPSKKDNQAGTALPTSVFQPPHSEIVPTVSTATTDSDSPNNTNIASSHCPLSIRSRTFPILLSRFKKNAIVEEEGKSTENQTQEPESWEQEMPDSLSRTVITETSDIKTDAERVVPHVVSNINEHTFTPEVDFNDCRMEDEKYQYEKNEKNDAPRKLMAMAAEIKEMTNFMLKQARRKPILPPKPVAKHTSTVKSSVGTSKSGISSIQRANSTTSNGFIQSKIPAPPRIVYPPKCDKIPTKIPDLHPTGKIRLIPPRKSESYVTTFRSFSLDKSYISRIPTTVRDPTPDDETTKPIKQKNCKNNVRPFEDPELKNRNKNGKGAKQMNERKHQSKFERYREVEKNHRQDEKNRQEVWEKFKLSTSLNKSKPKQSSRQSSEDLFQRKSITGCTQPLKTVMATESLLNSINPRARKPSKIPLPTRIFESS